MHPGTRPKYLRGDLNNPYGYPGLKSDKGGKNSVYGVINFGKLKYNIPTNADKVQVASTYAYNEVTLKACRNSNQLQRRLFRRLSRNSPKAIHPRVVARKAEIEADPTILEKLAEIQSEKLCI